MSTPLSSDTLTEPAGKPRVLVVDDDRDFLSDMERYLGGEYTLRTAASGPEGLQITREMRPQVVLLDLDLGEGPDGFAVLEELRTGDDPPAVIMLTGNQDVPTVVKAIKRGAFHYVVKPPDLAQLTRLVELCVGDAQMRQRVAALESEVLRLSGGFVVDDPSMRSLVERVRNVAATDATVLITGECGTGKEMVARLVHSESRRAHAGFVGVNCAAFPGELIESELFGHERGAFTGADRRRVGKFELAEGGTLFLDEIGDSPERFQLKLLRVLETRSFYRVGGDRELASNVRLVAATSRDLEKAIADKSFREELYYRLNVYRVHVPPLRERREEILTLAEHFLKRSANEFGREVEGFTGEAMRWLKENPWRGNVRELRNVVERAVLECRGDRIGLEHLAVTTDGEPEVQLPYDQAKDRVVQSFKARYLSAQLRRSGGNVSKAAELSGIARQSFSRMLRESGIDAGEFGE